MILKWQLQDCPEDGDLRLLGFLFFNLQLGW